MADNDNNNNNKQDAIYESDIEDDHASPPEREDAAGALVSPCSPFACGSSDDENGWGSLEEADDNTQGLTVHKAIRERISREIREANLIPGFVCSHSISDSLCPVRLGFAVSRLGLDNEQCRAYSLNIEDYLFIDIRFQAHYLCSNTSDLSVTVGVASSPSPPSSLSRFRLSWPLESRIKKHIQQLTQTHTSEQEKLDLDAVSAVRDLSGAPYLLCLLSLAACGDANEAANMLDDEEQVKQIIDNIQEGARQNITIAKRKHEHAALAEYLKHKSRRSHGGPKSKRQRAADNEQTQIGENEQQVMKASNCSLPVAKLALSIESSVAEAILLLSSETARVQLAAMARELQTNDNKQGNANMSEYEQACVIEYLSQSNPLLSLVDGFFHCLVGLASRCLLCDSPLEYVGLKPAICSAEVCKLGLEQFGLSFDLSDELKRSPALVDLLIAFTVAAARGRRIIANSAQPLAVTARKNNQDVNLLSGGQLDYAKFTQTLERIPSVADMAKRSPSELTEFLNQIDPLILPLLRWIITSNRAHIRELTEDERIKSIHTPHQFVLLSATPEQEAKFQELKLKCELKKGKGNGSIYAFHGSATANWHTILRTGLKNLSNTEHQLHGAAYGVGIYMAADSATSLGYSAQREGWARSMFGPAITALALCEVVNTVNEPRPYYVVPEEEKVTTRFIFVFRSSDCSRRQTIAAESLRQELPNIKTGIKKRL